MAIIGRPGGYANILAAHSPQWHTDSMNPDKNLRSVTKECLIFSLPLVAGQVGQMLFGIGDMAVAGRYNAETVAALGVAVSSLAPFFVAALGVTFALSPMASNLRAQNKEDPRLLAHGLAVAFGVSALAGGAAYIFSFFVDHLNLAPGLAPLVATYQRLTAASFIGAVMYQACKEYLQAYDLTFFSNALILALNVVNVGLNIVFVYGLYGLPEMGIAGTAWATTICRFAMLGIVLAYTATKRSETWQCWTQARQKRQAFWDKALFKSILKLGLPVSGSLILEVTVFSSAAVLAGQISVVAAAAHNIALNFASLTFMVPLALASTASVKVAFEAGANRPEGVSLYSRACVFLAAGFMAITAMLFAFCPGPIVRLATDQTAIMGYTSGLLLVVGLFQIPDGIQVSLSGVLRGLGITRGPMIAYFLAYWPLGLPAAYLLAFNAKLEATGLWLGLMVGVYTIAITLIIMFRRALKKLREEAQAGITAPGTN